MKKYILFLMVFVMGFVVCQAQEEVGNMGQDEEYEDLAKIELDSVLELSDTYIALYSSIMFELCIAQLQEMRLGKEDGSDDLKKLGSALLMIEPTMDGEDQKTIRTIAECFNSITKPSLEEIDNWIKLFQPIKSRVRSTLSEQWDEELLQPFSAHLHALVHKA